MKIARQFVFTQISWRVSVNQARIHWGGKWKISLPKNTSFNTKKHCERNTDKCKKCVPFFSPKSSSCIRTCRKSTSFYPLKPKRAIISFCSLLEFGNFENLFIYVKITTWFNQPTKKDLFLVYKHNAWKTIASSKTKQLKKCL